MKQTVRKGLIILITTAVLLSLCLAGAAAAEEQAVSTILLSEDTTLQTNNDLPSSYDLRDYGYVTPVRDQGANGVCWSFGTMGAIESNLLKSGLVATEDAENLDLSELQFVYFVANRDGVTKGDVLPGFENIKGSYYEYDDLSRFLTKGNNPKNLSTQLTSGIGVATEENDDLKYENLSNVAKGTLLDPTLAVSENAYYPMNIYMVDIQKNPELIKQLLMEKGAATISYYADVIHTTYSGYTDENGNNICTHNTSLDHSYQNQSSTGNHCVTLVGWDDNYPKENFARFVKQDDGTLIETALPEHDGAWLIKNSWGSELTYTEPDGTVKTWDGYAWISYDDISLGNIVDPKFTASMGSRNNLFFDVVPANDYYDTIYQYDGGFGLISLQNSKLYNPGDIQTISAKNIYTTNRTEAITAVSFYTGNQDVDYTLTIFVNGVPEETRTGEEFYEGYHTVMLSNPIIIQEGDVVTVELALSMITTDSEILGMPVDYTIYLASYGDNAITTTDIPGRSYIKFEEGQVNADTDWNVYFKKLLGFSLDDLQKLGLNIDYNDIIKQACALSETINTYADEDGWIDITLLPNSSAIVNSSVQSTLKPVDTKYGPARIKMFTVDVDEKTVNDNKVTLSEDNIVDEIYISKVIPGSTVYYADKLTNVEKPEGTVLGGFRIGTDGAAILGNKMIITFTAESENPENVTLERRNFQGGWTKIPTVYLGDDRYAATTTNLGVFAVVENEPENGVSGFDFLNNPFSLQTIVS